MMFRAVRRCEGATGLSHLCPVVPSDRIFQAMTYPVTPLRDDEGGGRRCQQL